MSPFAVDKRDIEFCLFEYLDIANKYKKFSKYSELDKETYDLVIDTAIRFAVDKLAPLNTILDQEGLKFENGQVITPKEKKEAYNLLRENGLVAPSKSAEFGGGGLPHVMNACLTEIMGSASIAFIMTPGLTGGAGEVIEKFGTDAQKNLWVEKLYSGEFGGTMCLTESGAGSAVGDLKTKAKKEGDHYLVEGEKIFISSGDHDLTDNIVHLVLGRIEGAPKGIKGISLFIVPKVRVNEDGSLGEPNNVACSNIEHKMGICGSPTCTIVFGSDGPCHAYLIGEEHQGIKYMFQMMNEARIGVGVQGIASAAASYQEALQYANDRIQGTDVAEMKDPDARRVPIIEHPDVRRNLLTMKSFVEGMRALIYLSSFFNDMSHLEEDEAERDKYDSLFDLLTPICKAYCSDWGFRMTEIGIQIFGGYGYTREYPQEQYCRDAKIASIYEGTNGIQALDLLGRKMRLKGGLLFMTYLNRMNVFIDDHKEHTTVGPYLKKLEAARDALVGVAMHIQQAGMGGDIYYPVLSATPFLDLFGTVVIANLLCEMAVIADDKLQAIFKDAGAQDDEAKSKVIQDNLDAKFYAGKVQSMRFFVDNYLPHAHAQAQAIQSGDRSALEIVF